MAAILKRFEIWLLLGLVVAAALWAVRAENEVVRGIAGPGKSAPSDQREPPQPPLPDGLAAGGGPISIKNIQLTPSTEGGVLELTLLGRSGTGDPVVLTDDNVELLTSDGDKVFRFFTPFESDPVLSPDEASLIKMRFWLKEKTSVLWLSYLDQTIQVSVPPA